MRKLADAVGQKIDGQFGTDGNRNKSAIAINPLPPQIRTVNTIQNVQLFNRLSSGFGGSKATLALEYATVAASFLERRLERRERVRPEGKGLGCAALLAGQSEALRASELPDADALGRV